MTVYYDKCDGYVVAVCACGEDSGNMPDELAAEQWWLAHAAEHDASGDYAA